MTEGRQLKAIPPWLTDERTLAWMEEHATELRQSVSGQRILYWSLGISFVIGLAAHVGGYALQSSPPTGFTGLLGDLIHALGWWLWTDVRPGYPPGEGQQAGIGWLTVWIVTPSTV